MTKKRIFSGVQPSGNLHIGNYFGAITRWAESQAEFQSIFCIVDLHAITVPQDPKALKEKIRKVAALYFAAGVDQAHSSVFVQSHVPAHAELGWILNCFIPMGWMKRMTQFKEKSAGTKESASVGLFDYPALMAADILLYQTDLVPVGEDQKQHVELARDVAQRFNALYGKTFTVPEAWVAKVGARIMGLDDPKQKMSKSVSRPHHAIHILDTPDEITKKIASATTDSSRDIRFEKYRPGIYNLLTIYELCTGMAREKIEARFEGKGYAEFKKALAEALVERLRPLQERYRELRADPSYIDNLLRNGAEKVRPLAEHTLASVKNKVGLG